MENNRNMARIIIPLIILVIVDIYVFQIFKTMGKDGAPWLQRTINIAYWAIPVMTIAIMMLAINNFKFPLSKAAITYGRAFIFLLYITKFLMAGTLLVGDIASYIGKVYQYFNGQKEIFYSYSRSKFLKNAVLAVGAIPFTTLLYGVIRNAYRYTIERVTVKLDNLPTELEGLKIIQISDIHSGSFTYKEPVKRAIELINKEEADLVFFTGDLVNDRASEMDNFMDVFDKIQSKMGVYSILGNHDYGDYARWRDDNEKVANFKRLKEIHKELGWNLLLNENRLLEVGNAILGIIGVENWSARGFRTSGKLDEAHAGTEKAQVKLLLSHDPSHWDAQVNKEYKDIDITFSGHTHGMQFGIRIPGLVNWSPAKFMYKQWGGLYQKGKQYIYVNRGLGFLGYPGRVGMLPEITVMELKKNV